MKIQELVDEAKALITGKKFGNNDIIIIPERKEEPEFPAYRFKRADLKDNEYYDKTGGIVTIRKDDESQLPIVVSRRETEESGPLESFMQEMLDDLDVDSIEKLPFDVYAWPSYENSGLTIDYVMEEGAYTPSKPKKLTHPRTWDPSDFGCGFGYGHAVNAYYAERRAERIQWIKNYYPVILGGSAVGGIITLALRKLLRK